VRNYVSSATAISPGFIRAFVFCCVCSWSGHELNLAALRLAAPSKPVALQELVQQQIRAGVAGEGSLPVRAGQGQISGRKKIAYLLAQLFADR
jgi:hypothetical protein